MNALAHAIQVREGDNVVVEDVEFGSVLYPWLQLRRRGVEVRIVRQRERDAVEGHYRAAVDGRTRVVAVSHVSYLTGVRHNVEALAEVAHASGAWLVLDATHAAGVVPVPAALCDFTLSACYKWLLGYHGTAILGWNRERTGEVEPGLLGWRTPAGVPDRKHPDRYTLRDGAGRFETGNAAYVSIFVLEHALRYLLETGLERICEHDLHLAGRLNAALRGLDLDVATPLDAGNRAANTCFWQPQPEQLAARLAEEGVWVSGGDGRIRIGTHLWCSEQDVELAVGVLKRLLS
jgi:selenocysteine lyase/cysteine desulfurase